MCWRTGSGFVAHVVDVDASACVLNVGIMDSLVALKFARVYLVLQCSY